MSNKNLYRPNVGIVIFNSKKKIWCGRRLGINTKDAWQLPQGGIDDNESPLEAAVREAYEETGIKSIKKISKIDEWIKYELPKDIAKNKWNGKFIGQMQKWFLFQFYGNDDEINININKKAEFSEWKWEKDIYIQRNVAEFRKTVYKKVFTKFSTIIKNFT